MDYVVQQGDHVARLAREHGLHAPEVIWNHPDNADLKSKRSNYNVLYPGDAITIPDAESGEQPGDTEKKHRFRLKGSRLLLILRVLDYVGSPVSNAKATLWLSGDFVDLTTDAAGKMERFIDPCDEDGRVRIESDKFPAILEADLAVGHLDPVDTIEGQIGRLNNLGYDAGPVEAPVSADAKIRVKSAIEEFQCDQKLSVDGICGPNTQSKLKDVHGC